MDDSVFRWVMVAGFVAVVAIIAPHRVRAATNEKLDRRKEGAFMLATLRPAGGALWLSTIAYMINPAFMAWSSVLLPVWLRWSGAVLSALAVALLIWTLPALGRNLTDTVVTRKEHTLVTRGPYRWIRHPFYVFMALMTVGSALVAANWFIFVSGVVVFLLLALRSRVEEEQLAARFGDRYREYQRRTGRFLPKLRPTQ
jgi:protein-S-isoprenylcysteine O-methyltransferase Ste14